MKMTFRRINAIALIWGLAEATVFFIVPDVLLSWCALSNYKRGFAACLYALLGALIGGLLTWYWGQAEPDVVRAFFVSLPGIDEALITRVQTQLADMGLTALIIGPLSGTPYKLYALEAPGLGYGVSVFLLISIPARLLRFVIVTAVIGSLGQFLQRKFTLRKVQIIHLVCWFVFYVGYFQMMAAR